MTLNTKLEEELESFDQMIRDADIYIQNFRPGAAQRLGAGEKRLRDINPRLIYCAISGFGQDDPASKRPAYDTVAQAASGLLNLLINPCQPPRGRGRDGGLAYGLLCRLRNSWRTA